MADKINKLTGEKVSDMMMELLERCSRDEYVSIEEFERTPEIKKAKQMKEEILNSPKVAETISYKVDNEKLRENIVKELLSHGSALIDKDGKVNYNGVVEQNCRLDIVIGLPASGKSSAIVDVLSEEFHSRVVDNDEAKTMLPDFNNGWGADIVHPESKKISNKQFECAVSQHDNIILPKVGGEAKSIMKYVDLAKKEGYEVYVHYVSLSRQKALGRMMNRFLNTGRFLEPKLINDYDNKREGNKIERTYEELKKEEKINGYSKWNNDVGFGEKPILIEVTDGCRGEFIRSARIIPGEHEQQEKISSEALGVLADTVISLQSYQDIINVTSGKDFSDIDFKKLNLGCFQISDSDYCIKNQIPVVTVMNYGKKYLCEIPRSNVQQVLNMTGIDNRNRKTI